MSDKRSAGAAIGWTVLSIVVPGAAHLRAGYRIVGLALLTLFLGAGVAATVVVLSSGGTAVLTDAAWARMLAGLCIGVGVTWGLLVIASYAALRPRRRLVWSDAVALVLVAAVLSPFVVASRAVKTVDDTLGQVFTAPEEPVPINHADPWAGRDRINILLLGGDGAADRRGTSIRTDSMNVASIDVKTGDTVLFALPREMENAPFPKGSVMRTLFPPPKGFYMTGPERGGSDLLNAVWMYADMHPEQFHDSPTRAPDAIKGAIGQILGLKIDYYVLVNMWGVAHLIDALGGVRIHVEQDICYGVGRSDGGIIRAGTHRLDGNDALWYGRARDHDGSTCAGGDNHTRMRRQHCVISAMLNQLDPSTVLFKFERLATAARQTFKTDIPRGRLQDLVPLADLVKNARVTTLSFVPPKYNPAYPDFRRIRADVRKAIARSHGPATPLLAKPRHTPKPTRTLVAATGKLSEACSA
ncbi:LCP family protein [Nonomuraea sediminis]|uniref:LCP family protein n=1 Tax=Nonomuraea sediminis TaxID=2835864 RepID=UPI001BDD3C59|nr:LCP family protein [Nonomuraea sediminis]